MNNLLLVYDGRQNPNGINPGIFGDIQGIADFRLREWRQLHAGDLRWCDILFFYRPIDHWEVFLAHWAKKHGIICSALLDDDLLEIHVNSIGDTPKTIMQRKALRRMLSDILIVTSPNQLLAEKYCKLGCIARKAIVDTYVASDEISTFDRNGSQNEEITKIVYAAGRDHAHFFNRYVMPVLYDLQVQCPKKFSLTFIGVCPDLTEFQGLFPIEHVPYMTPEQYKQYMKQHTFDIGLAPLDQDDFCQYKYYNKFIEYAKVGIAGIYSKCLPYTFVIQDGINGYLCNNKPEEWLKQLSRAIVNKEERYAIILREQEQLKLKFNRESIIQQLLTDCPEIGTYKVPLINLLQCEVEFAVIRLRAFLFFAVANLCDFGYRIKKNGLKEALIWLKKHIFR